MRRFERVVSLVDELMWREERPDNVTPHRRVVQSLDEIRDELFELGEECQLAKLYNVEGYPTKMATCEFWSSRFNAQAGNYQCPWCSRDLIPKLSKSAANPGKTFVSCAKDFGGCGLFAFLESPPNEKFNPNKTQGVKRAAPDAPRPGGSNIVGPIVSAPNATETRLADLAASVDALRSKLEEVLSYIKEVNDQ